MTAHASAETAPLVKYVSILHNNNKIKRLATAYRMVPKIVHTDYAWKTESSGIKYFQNG